MSGVFAMRRTFNEPIGNWNTSTVTSMEGMFAEARAFNQPIGNWNTSNVTSMMRMFANITASAFNQPIGNWNTSNALTCHGCLLRLVTHTTAASASTRCTAVLFPFH
jgi:surface protein